MLEIETVCPNCQYPLIVVEVNPSNYVIKEPYAGDEAVTSCPGCLQPLIYMNDRLMIDKSEWELK